MKNKKGKVSPAVTLVSVALIVVFIPVILALIRTADDSVLECENPDLPIFNETFQLCTNASGVGVVNETASSTGLTASQEGLLILIPLFLVISFFMWVVKGGNFK